jgi:hypothetical protein
MGKSSVQTIEIDGQTFSWDAVDRLGSCSTLLVGNTLVMVDSGDPRTNAEHARLVLEAIVRKRRLSRL